MKDGIAAYYMGRYATAFREFRPLAEEGVAEAQFYLGVMYAKGRGAPQDYAEALRWYRLAAEQGFAKAMVNLGLMYSRGTGVAKDYDQALRWYRLAAQDELPEALYNLGVMYKEGHGAPLDLVQAHMWFNLAAGRGHEEARQARATVARMMTAEQVAKAQKLAREWTPEKANCSDDSRQGKSAACP